MSKPNATKIMVIRHAEKPDSTLNGVKESGEASKHDLIVRGWQRAGALVCFFAPTNGLLQSAKLAQPEYLFASNPSDDGDQAGDAGSNGESKSHRPEETIKPLSEKLNVQIDLTWSKGQETEVAAAAQACDGVVLIAWQHEAIYKIANAILGDLSGPQTWPRNRFNIVYVFDRDAATGKYSFDQAPQCLLVGDQPEVIQQNLAAVPESVSL